MKKLRMNYDTQDDPRVHYGGCQFCPGPGGNRRDGDRFDTFDSRSKRVYRHPGIDEFGRS